MTTGMDESDVKHLMSRSLLGEVDDTSTARSSSLCATPEET